MKCYPLGVAAVLAITVDCIRRGDLDGARAALDRARALLSGEAAAAPRSPANDHEEGRAA